MVRLRPAAARAKIEHPDSTWNCFVRQRHESHHEVVMKYRTAAAPHKRNKAFAFSLFTLAAAVTAKIEHEKYECSARH